MKTTIKTMMLLMALILSLTACDKDDNTGTVEVKVTDAPFPFKFVNEAKVKIAKIELKNTDGQYVTVFEGNSAVNLVNYRNGATANIAVQSIPEGTYKSVKVTVDGAEVKLANGTSFNVDATENATVETMIYPELKIENGQEEQILMDVDLSDSFVFQGSFLGGWIHSITEITGIASFNPDIRVANLSATGAVSGIVKDENGNPVADAEVYIKFDYNGDGVPDKVSTVTEEDGSFKIIGLPEASYTLTVETEHETVTETVNVEVNNVINVQINITN